MADASLVEWLSKQGQVKREAKPEVEGPGGNALCSAVFLKETGLMGHPLCALDADRDVEEEGVNEYLQTVNELCNKTGAVFRGCLSAQVGVPVAAMNEFTKKSLEMKRKFAWSIPNKPALAELTKHAPLIEIGGGTGYWAGLLQDNGVDIHCYDCSEDWVSEYNESETGDACNVLATYGTIKKGGPGVAAGTDRTLVLMWPDFMGKGTFGLECLKNYTNDTLILIGEWADSTFGVYTPTLQPTGQSFSPAFQYYVSQHFEEVTRVPLPNWPLYKDVLMVFKRRETPLKRHWVMKTSPLLGRYLVAGGNIPVKTEVIQDSPLVHVRTSGAADGVSKFKEMYTACDEMKEFLASGLQLTGGDPLLTESIQADVESKHPEYGPGKEKCNEMAQIVSIASCFHYNGFGGLVGSDGELELRVFPTISFCNHSCAPNGVVVPNEGSFRSIRDIEKDESLSLAYLDDDILIAPRKVRQEALKNRWGFLCQCDRCSMPYDDAEVFCVKKQVARTEETKVEFSDPDGDVVALRVEGDGIVYSINGEDRPVTHHLTFDPSEGLLFPDIDRGVDLPDMSNTFLARVQNLANIAGVKCEGLHEGLCSCGGSLAGRVGTVLQCLTCNAPIDADVAAALIKEEEAVCAVIASEEKNVETVREKCSAFARQHPRHYLSYQVAHYLAANPPSDRFEAARVQGDLIRTLTSLIYCWPAGKPAINSFLAEVYSTWAERLMKADMTEEATEQFNELDRLRHINDIISSEWASVPDCQPNAQVMAFLFKD
eukprot:TRINITY_DN30785_c0_g1_i1.p1 TRINITY_DN30785_c0_g1~~TRINITY_DN30785_c0_g1_i1.p1  ORF type:complete len:770 (+),score=194.99 TRINITY_DN30785_c0_g1_i1:43-2352(+)